MSAVLEIGEVSVEAGEIVALLGGNGAGKTTLLETVLGFHPGRVMLFGRDASALAVEQRIGLGVGYVPEGRRVFAGLTVRENLEASSSLPAGQRRQRVDEMLALFPMLGERPEARAWLLSGGQQQMLALARALMDRPRLLLLDEPTLGLAPVVVADLLKRLSGHDRRRHGDPARRAARRPGARRRPARRRAQSWPGGASWLGCRACGRSDAGGSDGRRLSAGLVGRLRCRPGRTSSRERLSCTSSMRR